MSLLTTCLHALIRRFPPTFAVLSRPTANTRSGRYRSLIPVISGATAVCQTLPRSPLARIHSPSRVPTSDDSRLCNCFLIRRRTGHESTSGNSGKAYKRKVAGVDKVDTVGGVGLDHSRMEGTGRQRRSFVCGSQCGEFRCAQSIPEELKIHPNKLHLTFTVRVKHLARLTANQKILSLCG